MLFNSYEFILAYLPVTVAGFLLLGLKSRAWAFAWLIVASTFFYAWWRPFNLLLIGPSLLINYGLGVWLLGMAKDPAKSRMRSVALAIGLIFNLAFLGYFKYANFGMQISNDIVGTNFVFEKIILPLGVSFITFQKIAFLVDIASGRIKSFTVREFLLFVMFFPQLIAGPIVHFHESVPQFQRATCKFDKTEYAVGISLFVFGLFKKVVLADGIALHVTPIYAYAAAGHDATLLQAWLGAIGYTLQIYFDFSGYSDMACGAALLFGIRLPMNFNSPFKATNIIDFWQRWHMTLTRFLMAYVNTPLTINIMRDRAAKKLAPLKGSASKLPAFIKVLALPTLLTMTLSGVWHGAGYTFVLWGLMHGLYLISAHIWRQYGPKKSAAPKTGQSQSKAATKPARMNFTGFGLTFMAVIVGMVMFRAPNVDVALNIYQGMLGMNGIGMPAFLGHNISGSTSSVMTTLGGVVPQKEVLTATAYIIGLLTIALFAPNSVQMLSKNKPTLDLPVSPPVLPGIKRAVYWTPSFPWMILIGGLAVASMFMLTGQSEFLYWQF